jgi:hypothetical protein
MFIAVAPIYVAFFGFQDFRHGLPMGFQSESAPNARHVVDGSASLSNPWAATYRLELEKKICDWKMWPGLTYTA